MIEISGANTNLGLTQPSGEPGEPEKYYPSGVRNYARVVAVDNSQGAVDATLAQKLGAKSVYVLDDKESYGVGVAGSMIQLPATRVACGDIEYSYGIRAMTEPSAFRGS